MGEVETALSEWKTIRIPATGYYKLAEVSGLLTAVMGTKVPMSVVAGWAITSYHDALYQHLKEIMADPDRIQQVRKKWKEVEVWLKELSEGFTK